MKGYWKRKYHCRPLCGILRISTVCNISKPSISCSFLSLSLKKFRSEDGKYFFALGQGLAKSSVCAKSLQLCLTLCNPWNIVHQALLSMGFSRQEYWIWLPCPPPRDLPNPVIKPFLHWWVGSLPLSTTWEALAKGQILPATCFCQWSYWNTLLPVHLHLY